MLDVLPQEDQDRARKWIKEHDATLDDAQNSGKLMALESLLRECGIGASNEGATSQHRVLLFCQTNASVDLIDSLLLKKRMPDVSFFRLDSSVPLERRFELVTQFNKDPTVDLMLLTVKVGGLGLNLTGADTVIFFEHDWNPQVDAQAMDRAHRLGQKKVVNVYRLITKETLEEKIMSLQHFKMRMAKAVVNEENASMNTMDTGALLDLVDASGKQNGGEKQKSADGDQQEDDDAQWEQYKQMLPFLQ